MISIPTSVFYDVSRLSWVVEYGGSDRQEHFGRGAVNERRARERAAAMGLPVGLQTIDAEPVDPTGSAFTEKDWE